MHYFDESVLVNELEKQAWRERVAFAAATATRQLTQYEEYARRFDIAEECFPKEIAKKLWGSIQAGTVDRTAWASILDEVMGLLPEESDDWIIWHALADDALSSLAYAIRSLLSMSPQEAAWAARRAYEAADQAAIRILGVQPGLPSTEYRIKSHLLVQRELERQKRDLTLLTAKQGKDSIENVQKHAFCETLLTKEEMMAL